MKSKAHKSIRKLISDCECLESETYNCSQELLVAYADRRISQVHNGKLQPDFSDHAHRSVCRVKTNRENTTQTLGRLMCSAF